jgi:hypothetical protein
LYNLKDFPEGELMRVLEFAVAKNDSLSKAESDAMFNPMYENYGVAGEIFIRYVIANLPEVQRLLSAIQRKFDKAAGFTQRERFWSATAACALTSGIIAKKLGLHDIDVAAVYKWAVETLSTMRIEVRADGMTPLSRIGMFLNEKNSNMLIIKSTADKRSGLFEAPIREPRGELMTRYEPDTKLLFISTKALREWCSDNQISYKMICADLQKAKVIKGIVKKSMSKGSDMNTPSVFALMFDCTVATDLDPEVETITNDDNG